MSSSQESAASKPGMCDWGSFSYCAEPLGMGDGGRVCVVGRVSEKLLFLLYVPEEHGSAGPVLTKDGVHTTRAATVV
jgi:hypothetical protein